MHWIARVTVLTLAALASATAASAQDHYPNRTGGWWSVSAAGGPDRHSSAVHRRQLGTLLGQRLI